MLEAASGLWHRCVRCSEPKSLFVAAAVCAAELNCSPSEHVVVGDDDEVMDAVEAVELVGDPLDLLPVSCRARFLAVSWPRLSGGCVEN